MIQFKIIILFCYVKIELAWEGKPIKKEEKKTYYSAVLVNDELV